MSKGIASLVAALSITGMAGTAVAQDDFDIDIEIPVIVLEDTSNRPEYDTEELDLSQVVQSAVKGVTTVQEAPAIVTVVTSDDIKNRGYTNLMDVADSVPGWLQTDGFYGQFPFVTTRGTGQAMMYLVNSVQMFDPFFNAPSIWRVQPMETVKRVEIITGPGGVLWGANSFLGILNVITKDAEDVITEGNFGVETGITVGGGPGDRGLFRGYAMAGATDLPFDSKLFLHTSFETYQGPEKDGFMSFFASSSPQPLGPALRGPRISSDQERSYLFNLDGKISVGDKVNLYFSSPFTDRVTAQGFTTFPGRKGRESDGFAECQPAAIEAAGGVVPGQCLDPFRRNRRNSLNWFDRYVIGEYRTRLADGRAGITAKVYGTQFVRDFESLLINQPQGNAPGLTTTAISPSGLAISFDGTHYRAGANIDGDIELPGQLRILYGAEAFHEWFGNTATKNGSLQGDGVGTNLFGTAPSSLPLPCPAAPNDNWNPLDPVDLAGQGTLNFREDCPLTHVFDTDRTVLGVFANPQWKPMRRLTIDGGVRVQAAPESLGDTGYSTQVILSGGAVYKLFKDKEWFAKLNYAEGVRPPVFNNLTSNGEAIQFVGRRDLDIEKSQAVQGEINARVYRGVRRVREVNFRVDYSYTRVQNVITVNEGTYANRADRNINSVEFLGNLFLEGGHRIQLGYTWLTVDSEDVGAWRAFPNNWFNIGGVFEVVPEKLRLSTRMRILGAFEDNNQFIEFRDFFLNDEGRVVNNLNGQSGCTLLTQAACLTVLPHELVRDRIPPSAILTAGVTYMPMARLQLEAWAYNAFNGRSYQPDGFNSLLGANGGDPFPNQNPDFAFNLRATYRY